METYLTITCNHKDSVLSLHKSECEVKQYIEKPDICRLITHTQFHQISQVSMAIGASFRSWSKCRVVNQTLSLGLHLLIGDYKHP